METTVFLSAGDPSGDNAAGRLVAALRTPIPDLTVFGLGGDKLRARGQQQLADAGDLAVLGFWEVAKQLMFFRRLLRACVTEIKKRRPTAVILVDYPGFNLRLARHIKPLGIPVIYFISPQVWAWGRSRVSQIKRSVDLMLVILPFEQEFYRQHGVEAHFVGHYLLEDIPAGYQNSPVPPKGHLALLPGSRPQEIEWMLPVMLKAAGLFCNQYDTHAVVAGVPGRFDYETLLQSQGSDRISVSYDDSRKLIFESSLTVTASGTATLEAAIIGRPMVVVYKTGFITYQIARRLIALDKIALVNLVLGEKVVPELIQYRARPETILRELQRYCKDRAYASRVKRRLDAVAQLLGGTGASDRAARLICDHLGRSAKGNTG